MDRELSKQEQIKERKKRVLKAVLPIDRGSHYFNSYLIYDAQESR